MNDIFNHIISYLSICDATKLKSINKSFYKNIKISLNLFNDILSKNIDGLTESYGLGQQIISHIKHNYGNIKIIGSSILQCLNYDFYKESDIDIYLKYNPENYGDDCNLDKIIQNEKHISKIIEILNIDGLHQKKANENYYIPGYNINYYLTKNIDCSYHPNDLYCEKNKVKVQLLMVPEDYYNNMFKSYDFTFCRNYYDGKNVYSFNKIDVVSKTGLMEEWDNISSTDVQSKIKFKFVEAVLARTRKYLNRGYNIINYKQRLSEIDEDTKKEFMRKLYTENTEIIDIANSDLNNFIDFCYQIPKVMGHNNRRIELICQRQNGKVFRIYDTNGNPVTDACKYHTPGGKYMYMYTKDGKYKLKKMQKSYTQEELFKKLDKYKEKADDLRYEYRSEISYLKSKYTKLVHNWMKNNNNLLIKDQISQLIDDPEFDLEL